MVQVQHVTRISRVVLLCAVFSVLDQLRLLRWPIHGNLDVTLMLVFVGGGLQESFHTTMTRL